MKKTISRSCAVSALVSTLSVAAGWPAAPAGAIEPNAAPVSSTKKRDYVSWIELTTTQRVGMHRYTYTKDGQADIVINLGGPAGPMKMKNGRITRLSDTQLEGYYGRSNGKGGNASLKVKQPPLGPGMLDEFCNASLQMARDGGTTPELGYGGHDEDQGQMGGVSTLMSLGLFSVRGTCAVDPIYEITSPVFDKTTIALDDKYYPGKQFVISTENNTAANIYIQSAKLDGRPLNNAWFHHRELAGGGTLELVLGPRPNRNWGVAQLPPSESPPALPVKGGPVKGGPVKVEPVKVEPSSATLHAPEPRP